MTFGVRVSMTPWRETAFLAVGISGQRPWLPAVNRQLAGFYDPREYLATALIVAGNRLHLLGAALLTFRDADARATRYLRWGLLAGLG
jgi:hypothetical protein